MPGDSAEPRKSARNLKYPVLCHYKIITEDTEGIDRLIREALFEFGIQRPLRRGRKSQGGKYLTFNVEVLVNTPEFMELLDKRLHAIPGVRIVL